MTSREQEDLLVAVDQSGIDGPIAAGVRSHDHHPTPPLALKGGGHVAGPTSSSTPSRPLPVHSGINGAMSSRCGSPPASSLPGRCTSPGHPGSAPTGWRGCPPRWRAMRRPGSRSPRGWPRGSCPAGSCTGRSRRESWPRCTGEVLTDRLPSSPAPAAPPTGQIEQGDESSGFAPPSTPGPGAITSPAISWPGISGSSPAPLTWARMAVSNRSTAQA
jgi:hypothetical protein